MPKDNDDRDNHWPYTKFRKNVEFCGEKQILQDRTTFAAQPRQGQLPQLNQTPINFGLKSCSWQATPQTPSCVPNLKSPASMVAEIRSQISGSATLAQTSPILVLKVVSASYSPNPSFVPKLKSLDSTAAKISIGSQITGAPLAYFVNPTCVSHLKLWQLQWLQK